MSEERNPTQALQFMRESLDSTGLCLFWMDSDGAFLEVNRATCEKLGYNEEELISRHVSLVDPGMESFPRGQLTDQLKEEGKVEFRSHHRKKNGETFPVNVTITCVAFEEEEYVFALAQDITGKKQAENALEQEKERAQTYFEVAGAVIVVLDPQGNVQRINRAGCELLGYTREEIVGKNWLNTFVPPNWRKAVKDVASQLAEGKENRAFQFENPVSPKDGEERMCVWYNRVVRDDDGNVEAIVSSGLDVTERRRAEEEARRSAREFLELFEKSNDALFVYMLSEGKEPGRFLKVNSVACDRLGYTRGEVLRMTPDDVEVLEGDVDRHQIMQELNTKGQVTFEGVHLAKDGTRLPMEVTARLMHFRGSRCVLSAARDIRMRKKHEARVERLNTILSGLRAVNQLIVQVKDRDSLLQKICDALVGQCGNYTCTWIATFDEQEALRLDAERGLGEYAPTLREKLQSGEGPECVRRAFETGEVVVVEEGHGHCEACPLKSIQEEGIHLACPLSHNGEAFGVVWGCAPPGVGTQEEETGLFREIAEDISLGLYEIKVEREREEALDSLRAVQMQVVDQERQRALTQMASGIAHDFNNALSTIQGFTDLLLEDPEQLNNTEQVQEYLGYIQKASRNAAETVRRMRKFYKPKEEGETFQSLDLNNVVEEAIAITKPRWSQEAQGKGADIQLEKNLSELVQIEGDESELHDVVTNLIFNAVDVMEEGGTLGLTTRQEDGWVILEISDTGTGMSESERRHCFDPFYTTKSPVGTGLGLATVKGIVSRHEGHVEVETEKGKGSVFRIYLPVPEQRQQKQTESTGAEPGIEQTLDVLYVEDEESQRDMVREMLERAGHRVETAEDGREGERKWHEGTYDLVITDRAIPYINGDELAKRLKEEAPEQKVVLLTGFGDVMDAAGERSENSDMIVSKPLTREKLNHMLRTILGPN